jgi:hypothetical protein
MAITCSLRSSGVSVEEVIATSVSFTIHLTEEMSAIMKLHAFHSRFGLVFRRLIIVHWFYNTFDNKDDRIYNTICS